MVIQTYVHMAKWTGNRQCLYVDWAQTTQEIAVSNILYILYISQQVMPSIKYNEAKKIFSTVFEKKRNMEMFYKTLSSSVEHAAQRFNAYFIHK
jgi:hypothetical protein